MSNTFVSNDHYKKILFKNEDQWLLTEFRHIKKEDQFKLFDINSEPIEIDNKTTFVAKNNPEAMFVKKDNTIRIIYEIQI